MQLETRSSEAAVFQKRKRTTSGVQPVTYACPVRGGSIRRLDDPARSIRAQDAELAGRFVGYRSVDHSDQFSAPSTLVVVDLKSGTTTTLHAKPDEADSDSSVSAFVIKRSGSVAWIAVGNPSGRQGLWKDDSYEYEPPMLDSSPPAIDARSLRLSSDRRRVLWRRAGETRVRSAPLR